jgi:hypothetical protein
MPERNASQQDEAILINPEDQQPEYFRNKGSAPCAEAESQRTRPIEMPTLTGQAPRQGNRSGQYDALTTTFKHRSGIGQNHAEANFSIEPQILGHPGLG